ncbi:vacuolar fusion protein ccz1 [Actinomortierella wolfii]|nr:vacuolar fusion protein ccz1 [Actinomortierella wolfii]
MDLTGAPSRSQSNTSKSITTTSNVTPPRLAYFCIYNANFGPTEETQHEQLLYYYARKTVSIDAKMRQIGLAQGLTNFAKIFSPNAPCENVHSQKNRLVFYEAEPGYWLHMSIELGTIRKTVKGSDGKQRVITEYQEHDLHDTALRAMLEQAYLMYRVAHGTMDSLVQAHSNNNNSSPNAHSSGYNTRPLQRRLEEFFEPLVLQWDFEGNGTGFHIATSLERALNGIHYLPLSRETYVAIDGVLKAVKAKYEAVTHAMVTFENQLVSSDIRDEDLQAVWRQVLQWTGHGYWQPTFQDRAHPSDMLSGDASASSSSRKAKKSSGLAAGTFKFAKSWSNTGLFGFYKAATSSSSAPSSPPSHSPSAVGAAGGVTGPGSGNVSAATTPPLSPSFRPPSRLGSPAPSIRSVDSSGILGGSALDGTVGENKAELASLWFGQYIASDNVDEHYGITYKHKSGLALTFFILADAQEGMTANTGTPNSHGHEHKRKGATILEAESLARGIEELFSSHQYPSLEHYEARTQGDGNQELVLESNVEDATSTPLEGSLASTVGPSSPSYFPPSGPRSRNNPNATNSTFGGSSSRSSIGGGGISGSLRDSETDGEVDLSKAIEWVAKKVVEDAWTARRLGGALSGDKVIRYLYFNRMNFAIKSRLGFPENGNINGYTGRNKDPRAVQGSSTLSAMTNTISKSGTGTKVLGADGFVFGPEVALALLDIKQDFERMPDAVEITSRSPANHWVIGKRFEDREVYMIVSRKDSTLLEVEDEVRRITSLYFSGTTLSASSSATPAVIPTITTPDPTS